MPVEIRPYQGDAKDYLQEVERAFSDHLRDEDAAAWGTLLELDRSLAAYDGGRIVGTASAFSMELAVPGGALPCAGVTMVGVHATHRRRGILRDMMLTQIHDVRSRGEPIAALWASEGAIYQRFGYGPGSLKAKLSVERARNAFRRTHQPSGVIRFIGLDEAKDAYPHLYESIWRERPGFFGRSAAYWNAEFFHLPEQWRRGLGPPIDVVHEADGTLDGYARYAIRHGKDERQLEVAELMAATPAAAIDLWRFVLDVDLIGRVEAWNLAPDDPLLLTIGEPRRLGWTIGDALWLRIVDMSAALAGRRFAGSGEVILEVADELCPWNAGRWKLTVDGGMGSAAETDEAPDLALETTDLAAAYLGAFTFAQLAGALRVRERAPGAIARADALFRADRAPWCPGTF